VLSNITQALPFVNPLSPRRKVSNPAEYRHVGPEHGQTTTPHINRVWLKELFTSDSERLVDNRSFITDIQGVEVNWIKSHVGVVAGIAAVGLGGIIFLVVWFQPQTAFIDDVVNDTIPGAASEQPSGDVEPPTSDNETATGAENAETESEDGFGAEAPVEDSDESTTGPAPGELPPSFPLTLGEGAFIDLAHTGTGSVKIIELEDGKRILRIEDLDILNGPDLRVILSPSALVEDDGAYDDGVFVDLGPLKGNMGNQNYDIPPEIDIDDFATVAIWCRRFNVSFNAAPIGP
jgi:hypothetical protein